MSIVSLSNRVKPIAEHLPRESLYREQCLLRMISLTTGEFRVQYSNFVNVELKDVGEISMEFIVV